VRSMSGASSPKARPPSLPIDNGDEGHIRIAVSGESGLQILITDSTIVLKRGERQLEYASLEEIDESIAAVELGVKARDVFLAKQALRRLREKLGGVSILPEDLRKVWKDLTLEEKLDALSSIGYGLAVDVIEAQAIARGWLEPNKPVDKLKVGDKALLLWELIRDSGLFKFVKVCMNEEIEVYAADGVRIKPAKEVLEILCRVYGGRLVTKTVVKEVEGWALTQSRMIPLEAINPPRYLPVANGILDLETLELKRAVSAYFTYSVPARVNEGFLKALREGAIVEESFLHNPLWEAIRRFYSDEEWERLLDVLGSILAPFSLRLIAFIIGPENTGKSTLAEALRAALGPACASVPLMDIDRDPFALAPLIHARVNVTVERPDSSLRNVELLKRLVGGDTLSINRKHRPRIELRRNVLKVISFMNELPQFERLDSALLDRIVIIYTDNPLSEEEKDPSIKERLTQERDKVLEFLLWCMWRLQQKGWRIKRRDREEVRELLERARFPLAPWIEECCIEDDLLREKRERLYNSYVEWARESGVERVLSRRAFYALMRTRYPEVKIGGERYFKGIGLRRVKEPPEDELLGALGVA